MCCPGSPGACDKCVKSRIAGRDSSPDGFQQSESSPPHKASAISPTASSLLKNGRNWGQVFNVFSAGKPEWKCADRMSICPCSPGQIPRPRLPDSYWSCPSLPATYSGSLTLWVMKRQNLPLTHSRQAKQKYIHSFNRPHHTNLVCVYTSLFVFWYMDG